MKKREILVIGTGKSSWYLLNYLNKTAEKNQWHITATDRDMEALESQCKGMQHVNTRAIDISDKPALAKLIRDSDLVVSMLPASLHAEVAAICLENNCHLATASYVSPALKSMESEIRKRGLHFLNESGLDPGIDHMSAMKMIDRLKTEGAEITSFESYCGGLIAENNCHDPWKYKFTWNPMNVILAGQGGMSVFRENGLNRYIPWHNLFRNSREIRFDEFGIFDAYPNRDSLSYAELYHLQNTSTFIRGTLRRQHFCEAWQILVSLGFTDNSTSLSGIHNPAQLAAALTGFRGAGSFSSHIASMMPVPERLYAHLDSLNWNQADFRFSASAKSPAEMTSEWLQFLWQLEPDDQDEVYMLHKIAYRGADGNTGQIESSMMVKGENQKHTAMAKTVGLPLALGVEMILNGLIHEPGIHIPMDSRWYDYILPRLEAENIRFTGSH